MITIIIMILLASWLLTPRYYDGFYPRRSFFFGPIFRHRPMYHRPIGMPRGPRPWGMRMGPRPGGMHMGPRPMGRHR